MINKALEYISKGLPIIPIGPDKKPLVAWKEFQTRIPTIEEVTAWWTKCPTANIGMPTGKLSGISVVDIDPRHGGVVPEGMPNMTTIIKTGGGGWHYYFTHVDGVKNSSDENGTGFPGVDIRGEGGYVVVPPSHHASGNDYEVVVEMDLIPFPVDFFHIEHKKFDAASVVLGVGTGSRNMTATKLVGSMLAKYPMNEWETIVWPLLKAWNKTNTPPDDEKTLRITFESISKTHFRNHGQLLKESDYELKTLDKVVINETDDTRFSTGFPSLDCVLMDEDQINTQFQGGVALGEMMVIGGRPKHGKTLTAVQVAKSLTDQGFSCLWLSYEGKLSKLKKIMQKSNVNQKKIVTVELKNKVPLIGRVDWIEKQLKNAQEKFGVQLLVIDNLSFLQPAESSHSAKQFDMLHEIVPAIHKLASQYDSIVILLAHVRKPANQTGAPKRARMYDLSGTSTLEQLCDIGIMVERQYINENQYSSKTFLHLDANRPCGEVKSVECYFVEGKLVDPVGDALDQLGGKIINLL